jgi:transcription initiation factor TFIID subunit 6
VPYFVQFVSEKVTHSLNNIFILQQMMELTQAMTENKSLFIEPYVASLVPPILTCLIGRNPGGEGAGLKDQYQLRDIAASLIGVISNKFANSSGELQARLARTCLKYFLDPSRSLGEQYGAINGITSIGGPSAIQILVLPNLKAYEYILTKAQTERGPNDEGLRLLIAGIMKGITSITGESALLTNGANGNASDANESQEVEEYLGTIIGARVTAFGNHKLNKAILDSREKH